MRIAVVIGGSIGNDGESGRFNYDLCLLNHSKAASFSTCTTFAPLRVKETSPVTTSVKVERNKIIAELSCPF
jgi:hypothetical protein